jgi:uncharacterized membrane protein YtjA (UPF0391 family)
VFPDRGFAETGKNKLRRLPMLYWAAVFLVIAIIAGFFGFGGVAFAAAGIAKVLFFFFVVIFVVTLISGMARLGGPQI